VLAPAGGGRDGGASRPAALGLEEVRVVVVQAVAGPAPPPLAQLNPLVSAWSPPD